MNQRTGLILLILANLVSLVRTYMDWLILDALSTPLYVMALLVLAASLRHRREEQR